MLFSQHDVCKKKVGVGFPVLARSSLEETGVLRVLVTLINKVLPGQGAQTCPGCPAVWHLHVKQEQAQ